MDGKRSIQDIIPPARSRPIRPQMPQQESQPQFQPPVKPPTPPSPIDLNPNRPRGFLAFIFVLGGVLLIASIVIGALSTVFHRAYVTVEPYRFEVPVETTLAAAVDAENLPYEKVSTEVTKSRAVAATGSKPVEDRASGTLVVYNAYSTKSERLIANTRFESPEGRIYRVHEPVVVPAYTLKAGVKVPGSVEITVYADEPGEDYNIGLADFTIPGLKGTDQFTLMYAKSKTPISGGFIGNRAIVDDDVRSAAVLELKAEIDREARDKLRMSLRAGSEMFDSTVTVSYAESPDRVDGEQAQISVTGTAIAPAFDESKLAQVLAEEARVQYAGELAIENENALNVSVADPTSVSTESELSVTISGAAQLLAVYDRVELISELAGKGEEDITAVRANFPAIESLRVRIYPFWRSSIPATIERIDLEEGSEDESDS